MSSQKIKIGDKEVDKNVIKGLLKLKFTASPIMVMTVIMKMIVNVLFSSKCI